MPEPKKTLIVTGVARSGTTALAELLNSHTQVAIGIERFKFRYLREGDYDAGFFTKERFFDFREDDTNLLPRLRPAWKGTYDAIDRKWDTAAVIGDKVPDLAPVLPDFMATNPDYLYIAILRNLKDVGLSWQARALRTNDKWPKSKGFRQACDSWRTQMDALMEVSNSDPEGRRLLLLDYDRMYNDADQTEKAITRFLGIGTCVTMRQTLDRHVSFSRSRQPTKVPPRFVDAYKDVDMTTARELRRRSRMQIDALTDGIAA